MQPHSQIKMQKIRENCSEAPQRAQSTDTAIQFCSDKLGLPDMKKPGTVARLYSPVN